MLFYLLLILFQVFSALGFYFITPNNYWFLFLWIPLGFIAGWLIWVMIIFIVFYPILRFTKTKSHLKHEIIYQFCEFCNMFFRLKIKIVGRENIPTETFVVYANHKSMLDVSVVYQAFHKVMSAVAKNTLDKVKIIHMFMQTAEVVPLDRKNERQGVKDLLRAIKLVSDGYNFMIFPEGGIKTRETEKIIEIKPGAFKLATKPGASIVPVSIIGTSQCKTKSPWHKVRVKVIIHKPIKKEEYENMTTQEIGEKVVEIINSGIENENK